jgi:methylated-DNA-protein-cysteine methyltransferase-like protein
MGYYEDIRRAVCRIPRGKVATYGDVARAAGYPRTARQVSWALRHADLLGVPWQRVVGAGGRILLPGPSGELQRRLLRREGVRFAGARIDMKRHGYIQAIPGPNVFESGRKKPAARSREPEAGKKTGK